MQLNKCILYFVTLESMINFTYLLCCKQVVILNLGIGNWEIKIDGREMKSGMMTAINRIESGYLSERSLTKSYKIESPNNWGEISDRFVFACSFCVHDTRFKRW